MAGSLVGCQPTLCAVRLTEVRHSLPTGGASGVACGELTAAGLNTDKNLSSMLNKARAGQGGSKNAFLFDSKG